MEQQVKRQTHYERHKEERKAYQRNYRNEHLEEVRRKDNERKRGKGNKWMGDPPVMYPLVFRYNVVVSFD
jgi:hypothetical protein